MAKTATAAATTNTQATAPAPEAKAPTKMELAKKLYDEIYGAGYDLEGKSQRQVFIARAQAEIGLTKAGANTYFQNLSNEARGQGRYKYNTYEAKPKAEGTAGGSEADLPGSKAPTKAAVRKAEAQVTADLTKRWVVWNTKKDMAVNSFGTKKAADEYAAQVKGLEVRDSKAKTS